jgi:hypothetical protein
MALPPAKRAGGVSIRAPPKVVFWGPAGVRSLNKRKVPSMSANTPRASPQILSPGERIQAQPWSFIGLALTLGLTVGLLWRYKTLRKAARVYLLVRKII